MQAGALLKSAAQMIVAAHAKQLQALQSLQGAAAAPPAADEPGAVGESMTCPGVCHVLACA